MRLDFGDQRISVVRRAVFEDVTYINVIRSKADQAQEPVQLPAGRADKGKPLFIFFDSDLHESINKFIDINWSFLKVFK